MRSVAARKRPTRVVHSKREIKEIYMRYKVVVTRVQVAERFVRASSEEQAAAKIQEEFERSYGVFGGRGGQPIGGPLRHPLSLTPGRY
jgi:hypothetical protein